MIIHLEVTSVSQSSPKLILLPILPDLTQDRRQKRKHRVKATCAFFKGTGASGQVQGIGKLQGCGHKGTFSLSFCLALLHQPWGLPGESRGVLWEGERMHDFPQHSWDPPLCNSTSTPIPDLTRESRELRG